MPIATGTQVLCGIKKEVSYGVPVAIGAGDQFAFSGEEIIFGKETIQKTPVEDEGGVTRQAINKKAVYGALRFQNHYAGNDLIYGIALGDSVTSSLGEGVYRHYHSVNVQPQKSATVCFDKQVSIWEFCGIVLKTFKISGEAGKIIASELEIVGKNLDRVSVINPNSNNWTLPADFLTGILFYDLKAYIKDFSLVDGFTDDDEIELTSFELNVLYDLKVKRTAETGQLVSFPKRISREFRGVLTLPYYNADYFFDKHNAEVKQMAKLEFTGQQIEGTSKYFKLISWLPCFEIFPEARVPDDKTPELVVNFDLKVPVDVPAGFPSVADRELVIETVNRDDGSKL